MGRFESDMCLQVKDAHVASAECQCEITMVKCATVSAIVIKGWYISIHTCTHSYDTNSPLDHVICSVAALFRICYLVTTNHQTSTIVHDHTKGDAISDLVYSSGMHPAYKPDVS